jgi:hypothetical protein
MVVSLSHTLSACINIYAGSSIIPPRHRGRPPLPDLFQFSERKRFIFNFYTAQLRARERKLINLSCFSHYKKPLCRMNACFYVDRMPNCLQRCGLIKFKPFRFFVPSNLITCGCGLLILNLISYVTFMAFYFIISTPVLQNC